MSDTRRRRGFEAERELVRKLWGSGFAVVRAPASGARVRKAVYPDIVAMFKGKIFALEVKYRSDNSPIYIEKEQIQKLLEFARRAGATPLIAVKRPHQGWRLVPLRVAKETSSGRIRIDEEVLKKAMSLEEFVTYATNTSLESFMKRGQDSAG
ncbi:hypothetical protein CF15_06245 [Pyrodictium occultum]|uniref:Crossover junction endodeoxyribonuclease Hjc n=1 Tax=Pyrodictium occultum TaxID=2309 RepID=A0A0V8RWC3_PYROC|nr:Holliday junction resolvase Hjc [Pyrodictium occultum]KSW12337.1 hypothetical protein CF15_06245 [Pyrodictium occultum]